MSMELQQIEPAQTHESSLVRTILHPVILYMGRVLEQEPAVKKQIREYRNEAVNMVKSTSTPPHEAVTTILSKNAKTLHELYLEQMYEDYYKEIIGATAIISEDFSSNIINSAQKLTNLLNRSISTYLPSKLSRRLSGKGEITCLDYSLIANKILEQFGYNPEIIAYWTGKKISFTTKLYNQIFDNIHDKWISEEIFKRKLRLSNLPDNLISIKK